jgi:hypothetical protein
MALSLTCGCGARFEVEDTLAGQEVLCPECEQPLQAPTLARPPVRTSMLALVSAVLALVGALTVVGTAAAVLCGIVALVRIRRQRERLAGAGLALFGIVFGLLFTGLTVLAINHTDWFDFGGRLRQGMLAEQVDTEGPLEVSSPGRGFLLTRPSPQWGVARDKHLDLDDPFLRAFEEEQSEVILVQTRRRLFVDARCERNKFQTLEVLTQQVQERLQDVPADRRGPFDDDRLRDIRTRQLAARRPPPPQDDRGQELPDVEGRELELEATGAGQTWRFLIRLYKTDTNRLYILRAYGPARSFRRCEPELRQVLDSFRIIPPR